MAAVAKAVCPTISRPTLGIGPVPLVTLIPNSSLTVAAPTSVISPCGAKSAML